MSSNWSNQTHISLVSPRWGCGNATPPPPPGFFRLEQCSNVAPGKLREKTSFCYYLCNSSLTYLPANLYLLYSWCVSACLCVCCPRVGNVILFDPWINLYKYTIQYGCLINLIKSSFFLTFLDLCFNLLVQHFSAREFTINIFMKETVYEIWFNLQIKKHIFNSQPYL